MHLFEITFIANYGMVYCEYIHANNIVVALDQLRTTDNFVALSLVKFREI